jgi:hypothetical protein
MDMKNLFFLLVLTSCASYIHTPQNRMISPEAQGKFLSGAIDLRLSSTKEDEWSFTNNDTKRPFDGERDIYKISGMIDLGLLNRLDLVYLDYLSGSTVGIIGLKVQVLGDSRMKAKKGNFSLSLFAGGGANSDTISNSSNDLSNLTSNVDKLEYDVDHEDLGVIIGYRWSDSFLHYANAYYFHENINGKVTTDGNALNKAKFKDTQDGMIYSTGLILDIGASWFLKGDDSHMTSNWSSTRGFTSNAVNGGIGVHW